MKLKIYIFLLVLCSISLAMAMDEPPPHCTTDKQKTEYAAFRTALLSGDAQTITACAQQYGFDLNTRCMNLWYNRIHHPTYPIEWVISKTYDAQYIRALLQAGVPVQGYGDYSPLVDLVIREGLNDIECVRLLHQWGADPTLPGYGRDRGGGIEFPLGTIVDRKHGLRNAIYKNDVARFKRLCAVEAILLSPRPEHTPTVTAPAMPFVVTNTAAGNKTSIMPTRVLAAVAAGAVAVFAIKKLYDWYFVSDEISSEDHEEDQGKK